MPEIDVVHWNPRRSRLPRRLTAALPFPVGRRVDNFGDLLGPMVVRRLLESRGISPSAAVADRRLLAVGSILHFAQDGDVVWGAGVNGKKSKEDHRFRALDIRAVRGPLTREFLLDRGVETPPVFGDPALLLPRLMPELGDWAEEKRYPLTLVPNLNDLGEFGEATELLDPRSPVPTCLRRLAQSELVVGSSLHAIVVAESLGIQARLIASGTEDRFKYDDYYLGTGRSPVESASSLEEAVALGGGPPLDFDCQRLLDAFPTDLWIDESLVS
jgi:pyruvyltransferase